jgi:hypothetical protein
LCGGFEIWRLRKSVASDPKGLIFAINDLSGDVHNRLMSDFVKKGIFFNGEVLFQSFEPVLTAH